MSLFKFLVSTALLTMPLLAQAETKAAPGCCVGEGDPWYSVHIVVDPKTVPAGAKVWVEEPRPPSKDAPLGILKIANTNSIPLVFALKGSESDPVYPEAGVPHGWRPIRKFQDAKAYTYDYEAAKPSSTGAQKAVWREFNANFLPPLSVKEFAQVAQNRVGDGRPKNQKAPPPEKSVFVLFSEGKPVEIALTTKYTINKNYDSRKMAKTQAACEGKQ